MNKMTFGSATLLSLVMSFAACDGTSSPTFVTPTPTATYTLSGVISEMTATGPVPIEGARVADTVNYAQTTKTDASGLYSLPGLTAMSRSVSVTKDGYVTETKPVTLSGDARLDIQIERVPTYVLSGMVFEITVPDHFQVPIEGVEVYCDSCGSPVGHTFVYTDADGFYSLAWTINGVHPLFVTKAGYEIVDPTGTLVDEHGRISATVRGDTRFNIQLARR